MLGIYLIVGALAGTISGLLGIGGGTIVVPALRAIFADSIIIPSNQIMQMAIGTSLATMVFTTLSGSLAHILRGTVRWQIIKRFLPYLLLGIIFGSVIVHFLPSNFLKIIFSIFLAFISLRLLAQGNPDQNVRTIPEAITPWLAAFIGTLMSILGAGGGVMMIPFFMRLQLSMHEAIGTSLVCGVFSSLVATICFMLIGLITSEKVVWSTGYIYWPAFIGIILASILFAPLGAALAHKLPTTILKRIFALFLLLMAIDMFIFSR